MNLGHVSVVSIIGMIISMLIAIGLPVFLMLFVRKKEKAQINFFFIGAAVFVLAALFLEQSCHALVFSVAGDVLKGNVFLYALYAGLAAAVFEETGRLIAMNIFSKRQKVRLNDANAFMYGIGHGGAESILLVGITCINNLTTSVMINNGSIETTLKALDAKTQSTVLDSIKALWTTAPYEFYLAGVERIFAIAIQIALSMLMYTAIRYGKKWLIALAFEIHFMVDFVTVLAGNFLDDIVMELLIGILAAMISYATYRIWKRCSTEQQS